MCDAKLYAKDFRMQESLANVNSKFVVLNSAASVCQKHDFCTAFQQICFKIRGVRLPNTRNEMKINKGRNEINEGRNTKEGSEESQARKQSKRILKPF